MATIIFTSGSNISIADNYNFNYVEGNLSITPTDIIIELNDSTKIYDNSEFIDYDASFTLTPFELHPLSKNTNKGKMFFIFILFILLII